MYLHMYVCIYVCVYYACTCACMYVCVYVHVRMYVCIYSYVCICVCVDVCMRMYVSCIRVRTYVGLMYVCVCVSTIWTYLRILVKPCMKVRHWSSSQRRNCTVLPWPVNVRGHTEGRTDITKQRVALDNFANRNKNQKRNLCLSLSSMYSCHLTFKLQSLHKNTPQPLPYRAISTNNS
jgi:hypothetical protein